MGVGQRDNQIRERHPGQPLQQHNVQRTDYPGLLRLTAPDVAAKRKSSDRSALEPQPLQLHFDGPRAFAGR